MTYKIEIPANPADSGITTLEATDPGTGKARILGWLLKDTGEGAWHPLSLTNGQPTKVGLSWRSVLETYDDVREPADPVRETRTEIADEIDAILSDEGTGDRIALLSDLAARLRK